MRRILPALFAVPFLFAVSCGDDDPGTTPIPSTTKGVVDVAALSAGITVTVTGTLGEVTVGFTKAIPAAADETFESVMTNAVSLVVENDITGVTANLTSGIPVTGTPADFNEFSWTLNEARTEATLTFYNATNQASDGFGMLVPGETYTATLTVASNVYVANLAATSFTVTAQ